MSLPSAVTVHLPVPASYEALPAAEGMPISRLFHPKVVPAITSTEINTASNIVLFIFYSFEKVINISQ
jgi:hypothetical protein